MMSICIIIISLLLLIFLVAYYKVDAFFAFVIVSVVAALCLGIPVQEIPDILNKGVGNIYRSMALIIIFGAMLGKLVAESGAAQKIAQVSLCSTISVSLFLFRSSFLLSTNTKCLPYI